MFNPLITFSRHYFDFPNRIVLMECFIYKYLTQGRSQDVSLRGVSVRAKRAGYVGTFLGERSESVTPAAGERFLGLTARKPLHAIWQ